MDKTTEKKLTLTYILCLIVGVTASITTGIAWGHWKQTLDQCQIGKNCSCILYGRHTPSVFLGGDLAPCIWVTFGPLFYVFFCLATICFHGYRVVFSNQQTHTRTIMTKNESGETIEMHAVAEISSPLPRAFWIISLVFTIFWAIYALIHFSIFIDGYYKTCNEYRKTLENLLGVHGTAIPVIHGRLSCTAIFDFMDYMQPDSGNAFRDGFINTGLDLIIGVIASFCSWILFAFASFLNFKTLRSI